MSLNSDTFPISVPNHDRSLTNLGNFKEYQRLNGGDKSQKPKEQERKFSYLATKIPQSTLKSFDWFEERRIFKKLCRGDPMPRVSKRISNTRRVKRVLRYSGGFVFEKGS